MLDEEHETLVQNMSKFETGLEYKTVLKRKVGERRRHLPRNRREPLLPDIQMIPEITIRTLQARPLQALDAQPEYQMPTPPLLLPHELQDQVSLKREPIIREDEEENHTTTASQNNASDELHQIDELSIFRDLLVRSVSRITELL